MSLEYLVARLTALGHPPTAEQAAQLERFVAMLRDWNTRVNLVSRKDEDAIWRSHVLHSLAALTLPELPPEGRFLDIGTGGGFPGLPLAIMLPRASFTLCDSIGKKIRAVEDMAAQLGLERVRCVHSRVEDLPGAHGGEGVDVVLARAVTRLDTLAGYARPLLDWRGPRLLLVWKGGDITAETEAARQVSGVARIDVQPIEMPGESYFLEEDKKLAKVWFA